MDVPQCDANFGIGALARSDSNPGRWAMDEKIKDTSTERSKALEQGPSRRGILAAGASLMAAATAERMLPTPAYSPSDVYAGVLMSALGFIEMGTTTIVDLSQIGHSPEHSDACIRALQDSGIRALFGYGRGSGPAARYPQDLRRLQRSFFSSKDQLLTLG